ncbi:protein MpLEA-like13 [Marchantia polymorpha subsp. ruderalis]|uniref:Late embryogenesis abundant protein LEA-2 subgroup domain-containing protein n=2 Tax=Marchantia polymorpha TaxID=3197 RepID=A0AAF6AXZ2_MARPO|nr:hypothetical protein MARPO_0006s0097 [Marchantia polymorpha]BBN04626.1 hypothetical protein Mp_3g06270 [Marchantia polymorpha subsp. ruderalis]|eukprot:PTQ48062.1 hypothetical protein MARPO_0006s0097 [Marchantia polymorpha]
MGGDQRDENDDKGGGGGVHWCAILIGLIIVVAIIIVVLALTVFKVRDPEVTVNKLDLTSFSLTFSPSGPMLSFALNIDVTVKNRNHASFKYQASTAYLYYRSVNIGSAPIPAGKVGARSSTIIATQVTIDASAFIGNPNLSSDITAGVIPLLVTTSLPGKINVANIVKHHATSTANCQLSIFTQTATVGALICDYKFKL